MKKLPLKALLVFLPIFVVGFFLGLFLFKTSRSPRSMQNPSPQPDTVRFEEIAKSSPESKTVNILFLGKGGAGHDGGGLTDSITLGSFNYSQKKATLIAIPRDLWYDNQKINALYAESPQKLKEAVGQITGLKANYYLAIDFNNFVSAVNLLGGIDVNNPVTWSDPFYPIKGEETNLCGKSEAEVNTLKTQYSDFNLEKQFTCRYEQLHFEKGLNHLDGITALKYMRSRHSPQYGSDFARGEKAQAVLTAIGQKILDEGLTDAGSSAVKKLAAMVATDIYLPDVSQILATLGNLKDYQIKKVNLTDQNVLTNSKSAAGAFILIPQAGTNDFSQIQTFVGQ